MLCLLLVILPLDSGEVIVHLYVYAYMWGYTMRTCSKNPILTLLIHLQCDGVGDGSACKVAIDYSSD